MLEKLKASVTWPVVALFASGLAAFVAIALWAPEDVRTVLFGAHGLIFTLLGWLTTAPGEKN